MTFWPLLITTGCYLLTSYGFWRDNQPGLAIAFLFYGLANTGFLYISLFGSK